MSTLSQLKVCERIEFKIINSLVHITWLICIYQACYENKNIIKESRNLFVYLLDGTQ